MKLQLEAEFRPEESDAQRLVYRKTDYPRVGRTLTALGLILYGLALYLVIRIFLTPGVVEDGVETRHLELIEWLSPFFSFFFGAAILGFGLVLLNKHEVVIDKSCGQIKDATNFLGWRKVTERSLSEFDSVGVERTERNSGSGENQTTKTVYVVNLKGKQGHPPLNLFEKSKSKDAHALARQVGEFLSIIWPGSRTSSS